MLMITVIKTVMATVMAVVVVIVTVMVVAPLQLGSGVRENGHGPLQDALSIYLPLSISISISIAGRKS